MTDRIKGYLVTLDGDWRDDDAEKIENAIRQIRGVEKVEPYVKGSEDYMMYDQAQRQLSSDIIAFLKDRLWKKNGMDQH